MLYRHKDTQHDFSVCFCFGMKLDLPRGIVMLRTVFHDFALDY